MREVTL